MSCNGGRRNRYSKFSKFMALVMVGIVRNKVVVLRAALREEDDISNTIEYLDSISIKFY